jgi:hypothetical protein
MGQLRTFLLFTRLPAPLLPGPLVPDPLLPCPLLTVLFSPLILPIRSAENAQKVTLIPPGIGLPSPDCVRLSRCIWRDQSGEVLGVRHSFLRRSAERIPCSTSRLSVLSTIELSNYETFQLPNYSTTQPPNYSTNQPLIFWLKISLTE